MTDSRWIRSLGGPMICMEEALASSWGGIERLSVPSTTAMNDYERASEAFGYVQPLPLKKGTALVFAEGPLATSLWRCPNGQIYIVQILSCEERFQLAHAMTNFTSGGLKAEDSLRLAVASPSMVVFDSVEKGALAGERLEFQLSMGSHLVNSYIHNDDQCSLLLFDFKHLI